MMKCWEQGSITQEVVVKKGPIEDTKILSVTRGNGYKNALEMPYLSELKEYINKVWQDTSLLKKPVVFLAPNHYIARQAYLVLCRSLGEIEEEIGEEEDLFSYDEIDISEIDEDEQDVEVGSDEILVVLKEHYNKTDKKDLSEAVKLMMGGCDTGERFKKIVSEVKYLFMELEFLADSSVLDEVMDLKNEHIGLFLKPIGSYQNVVRRLCFEREYSCIKLSKPSREEYITYAKKFIENNGFKVKSAKIYGELINELQNYRAELFIEQDIYTHLNRIFKKVDKENRDTIEGKDLSLDYIFKNKSAKQRLDEMIGLQDVKDTLIRKMAVKKKLHDTKIYSHMIFAGPPGVGKSVTARILADYMGENGLSNGRFVDAQRADIIGKYVGHTADNIKNIFARAEGGVLFIDEAAFLLSNDVFAKEAVIELVRYMEIYPETTVILATYPDEARQIIELDSGLASRFKQTIQFPCYSNDELYRIMMFMAKEMGFSLASGCREPMEHYINQIRNTQNYGNAREVRKLLETAIEEFCINSHKKNDWKLGAVDFEKAAVLLSRKIITTKQPIGFI